MAGAWTGRRSRSHRPPGVDRPTTSRGHERVAGPRGRRLGLERGMILSPRATGLASWLRHDRDPGRGARPAASSPSPVGGPAPSLVQRSPLVSSCRPSPASTSHGPGRGTTRSRGPGRHGGGREVLAEEPDGEDVLAAHPSIRAVLETEAEYVLGSGPARQGARPRADSRWVIDGWEREGRSSLPGDSRGVLEAGARVERREEARAAAGIPQTPRRTGTGSGGRSRWPSSQASRRCLRGWISSETTPGRGRPP